MVFSQSSRTADVLSDVLALLRARAGRVTRFEGGGDWSMAFPAAERLKFVAVQRGACWIMPDGSSPTPIGTGDCCLLGRAGYSLTSDPRLSAIDGAVLYANGRDIVRHGSGDTIMVGCSVSFASGDAAFLLDMMPSLMHVPHASSHAELMRSTLGMLNRESTSLAIGSDIIATRLAEVLMVEAVRAYVAHPEIDGSGWFGALADPRVGHALQAIHADIARAWTVEDLAREAGMSRAAFSAAFSSRVGSPPLSYLRRWRLTCARAALAEPRSSVAAVARSVGYTSQSAFGHAFRRMFGSAPRGRGSGRLSERRAAASSS